MCNTFSLIYYNTEISLIAQTKFKQLDEISPIRSSFLNPVHLKKIYHYVKWIFRRGFLRQQGPTHPTIGGSVQLQRFPGVPIRRGDHPAVQFIHKFHIQEEGAGRDAHRRDHRPGRTAIQGAIKGEISGNPALIRADDIQRPAIFHRILIHPGFTVIITAVDQ